MCHLGEFVYLRVKIADLLFETLFLCLIKRALSAGLLHDVHELGCDGALFGVNKSWVKERVESSANLEGSFTVSSLILVFCVDYLCLGDNGNQQVQHENNKEENGEEEDQPVVVVEVVQVTPFLREIAKTGFESDLPPVDPVFEVGAESEIDVFEFRLYVIIMEQPELVTLADRVETVREGVDAQDEHNHELAC